MSHSISHNDHKGCTSGKIKERAVYTGFLAFLISALKLFEVWINGYDSKHMVAEVAFLVIQMAVIVLMIVGVKNNRPKWLLPFMTISSLFQGILLVLMGYGCMALFTKNGDKHSFNFYLIIITWALINGGCLYRTIGCYVHLTVIPVFNLSVSDKRKD